ncbi:hypothetical protein [Paenibacillus sp. FSL P4-0502]|uniref:hypothetical protein n=1 Tax=Paenibacillus sp. FSL P4-0502 TaxID=2975319 RepID=UPI0030FAED69
MNINDDLLEKSTALNFAKLQLATAREINRYLNSDKDFRPRKYSRENIRRYLANPETYERQIRETSQYLYSTSSNYLRICQHFSKMLTLDNYIVPVNLDIQKINPDSLHKNYDKAQKFVEAYNIKHEFRKIIDVLVLEDIYFGYEVRAGDSFGIFRLPTNYCRITGIEDGSFIFKFNMQYFSDRKLLEYFPNDFKDMHSRYLHSNEKWQEVDSNRGICFKIREDLTFPLPMLSGVFEDVLDLEDKKDLVKRKNKLESFKLLHQKIPYKKDPKKSDDFLIELDSVQIFHNNIKQSVPEDVVVVSTPMDLSEVSFERKTNSVLNNASKEEESIFNSAGVSNGILGSDNSNSVTVKQGIIADASIMFALLRQFETFFKRRLKDVTSRDYIFKLEFMDNTYYNQSDKVKEYTTLGQYGLPKTHLAATMGITVSEMNALNYLENTLMNVVDNMKPLSSSHTATDESTKGAPEKDDLTPNGEKTRTNKSI